MAASRGGNRPPCGPAPSRTAERVECSPTRSAVVERQGCTLACLGVQDRQYSNHYLRRKFSRVSVPVHDANCMRRRQSDVGTNAERQPTASASNVWHRTELTIHVRRQNLSATYRRNLVSRSRVKLASQSEPEKRVRPKRLPSRSHRRSTIVASFPTPRVEMPAMGRRLVRAGAGRGPDDPAPEGSAMDTRLRNNRR